MTAPRCASHDELQVAKLGVLTKLERAGLRLRDIEPLLVWGAWLQLFSI